MGIRLHVGNLSYQTTEDTLRSLFSAQGRQVQSVSLIADRTTGQPRGFAFVEMGTTADAQAAIAALDGQDVDGRAIRVSEARERGGGPGTGRGARGEP